VEPPDCIKKGHHLPPETYWTKKKREERGGGGEKVRKGRGVKKSREGGEPEQGQRSKLFVCRSSQHLYKKKTQKKNKQKDRGNT